MLGQGTVGHLDKCDISIQSNVVTMIVGSEYIIP